MVVKCHQTVAERQPILRLYLYCSRKHPGCIIGKRLTTVWHFYPFISILVLVLLWCTSIVMRTFMRDTKHSIYYSKTFNTSTIPHIYTHLGYTKKCRKTSA